MEKGKEGTPEPGPQVPYFSLYRFSDGWDKLGIFIGVIASLGHGSLNPIFVIFFGDALNNFNGDELIDGVARAALNITYLAIASAILSYFQVAMFTLTGQRQALRIRHMYFKALLSQDMSWYDKQLTGALSTRISSDIPKIQDAIGDKVGGFLQFFGMFVGGFGVGFGYSWKLTLVILSVVPLMIIGGAVFSKVIGKATTGGQANYSLAGGIADEVIHMIRTVIAFGTQEHEAKRYEREIAEARRQGIKTSLMQGISMGFFMAVIFASYSLTFWYGSRLVRDEGLTGGSIVTVFFGVIIGAMAIGQASPNIATFAAGRGAAAVIFEVIDRASEINSLSEEGLVPERVQGSIKFDNVGFAYPTRKDEPVLSGFTMEIHPKETVALVGSSGCGKSTVMALLERFYDPDAGTITLDGHNIKDLNVQWLRAQIALVEQTPVLFPTTIYHNIALGKKNATKDEVIAAAKMSNAHNFIMTFPEGYETQVGDAGAQLSGGQKQRIAIARALIKQPEILLLDEATSALDNESEKLVQAALDDASKERTTILIAHRLSTTLNANRIIVVDKGAVVETGSPEELLERQGFFYKMVALQHAGKNYVSGMKLNIDTLRMSSMTTKAALHALESKETNGGAGVAAGAAAGTALEPIIESKPAVVVDDAASTSKDGKPKKKASKKDSKKGGKKGGDGKDGEEEEELEEDVSHVTRSMLWWGLGQAKPERFQLILGAIGAGAEGLVWPIYAILISEIINVILNGNDESEVKKWAFGFLGLAASVFFMLFCKFYFLGVSGEYLTWRLRKQAFRAMILKDASWYDEPVHSKGILTTRLSADTAAVRGILGDRLAIAVTSVFTVLGGMGIAFYFCWKVGLVVLASFPVVAVGGALQFSVVTGFVTGKHFERSGKFAGEVIEHVRTVASMGRLQNFVEDYYGMLVEPSRKMRRTAQVQGLAFGFTEFAMLAIWALAFWFGSTVVEDKMDCEENVNRDCSGVGCSFNQMFKSIMSIVFMAMIVGQMQALAPDSAKAKIAAKRIYALLEDQEKLEEERRQRKNLKPEIKGEVELRHVKFAYPTRPDATVLKDFSLHVKPGQTLALVGRSGCGKSTSISLIEQLYLPQSGEVVIDGVNALDIEPTYLRQHIGLVTQQPELFSMTITENIVYGIEGEVDMDRVMQAAKEANAHNFISEFPDQYNTLVGEKGMQLSGGQRQRVAIARALYRREKIKILLLDEASAALDTESEKLVHHALDRARKGRTTIIVAHRLSTIRNADCIAVVDGGVVVEQGTHAELMEQKKAYYDLVNQQQFVTMDDHQEGGEDAGHGADDGVEVIDLDTHIPAQPKTAAVMKTTVI